MNEFAQKINGHTKHVILYRYKSRHMNIMKTHYTHTHTHIHIYILLSIFFLISLTHPNLFDLTENLFFILARRLKCSCEIC